MDLTTIFRIKRIKKGWITIDLLEFSIEMELAFSRLKFKNTFIPPNPSFLNLFNLVNRGHIPNVDCSS